MYHKPNTATHRKQVARPSWFPLVDPPGKSLASRCQGT